MKKIKGFTETDRTYKAGKPEARLRIDRAKASELGVPVSMIAMTIRTFIAGEEVTKFAEAGKEFDVIVKLSSNYRDSVNKLLNLHVRSMKGQLIKLSNIVKLDRGRGLSEINRFGREREIMVSSNLEGLTSGEAMKIIDEIMKDKIKLPTGYHSSHEGMSKNMMESFNEISNALLLSFLIVYIVLAIQFNSFIHPVTILISVPLAFVGGWIFLLIFGKTMNIFSMVGMVLLIGIVTKNAILLIDFIMQYRNEGMSRTEAILKAGPIRLRPILMTAFSTMAGMIPLALELSEGAEMRSPMAFVIIGGLITSTLLTLLVIPVVYTLFDDIANNRLFKGFLNLIIPRMDKGTDVGKQEESELFSPDDQIQSNIEQYELMKKLGDVDTINEEVGKQPATAYESKFDLSRSKEEIQAELNGFPDFRKLESDDIMEDTEDEIKSIEEEDKIEESNDIAEDEDLEISEDDEASEDVDEVEELDFSVPKQKVESGRMLQIDPIIAESFEYVNSEPATKSEDLWSNDASEKKEEKKDQVDELSQPPANIRKHTQKILKEDIPNLKLTEIKPEDSEEEEEEVAKTEKEGDSKNETALSDISDVPTFKKRNQLPIYPPPPPNMTPEDDEKKDES